MRAQVSYGAADFSEGLAESGSGGEPEGGQAGCGGLVGFACCGQSAGQVCAEERTVSGCEDPTGQVLAQQVHGLGGLAGFR